MAFASCKRLIGTWAPAELRDRKVRHCARAAREIALLLEGCVALMLIHGNNHYATVAAEAARRLLTAK